MRRATERLSQFEVLRCLKSRSGVSAQHRRVRTWPGAGGGPWQPGPSGVMGNGRLFFIYVQDYQFSDPDAASVGGRSGWMIEPCGRRWNATDNGPAYQLHLPWRVPDRYRLCGHR